MLLDIVKQIVTKRGEQILFDPQMVNALLLDLAKDEPKPQRRAFVECIEHGAVKTLKDVAKEDRIKCKEALAQQLHTENGLDLELYREAIDILCEVLFEYVPDLTTERYNEAVALYDAKRYTESVQILEILANQGYHKACIGLGCCYEYGIGVIKDDTKAINWYHKADEYGSASAQFIFDICNDIGLDITIDVNKAAKWLGESVRQGNVKAKKAVEILNIIIGAECGDAWKQFVLGWGYATGQGVARDDIKAVEWLRKSAEQGLVEAQSKLGFCYASGIGVTDDNTKAVELFRKAAEQGYAEAQNYLGLCYANGNGIEKDFVNAVEWFTKAAEQGYAAAQYNLGLFYTIGQGVTEDYSNAVKWFRKAAEQKYDGAKEKYNEMSEKYYLRGVAYIEKGYYDQALTDFTEALNINPNYAYAYLFRGDAYYLKGEFDLAITNLTKAIKTNDKKDKYVDKYAYFWRGQAYCANKKYDNALNDYNTALEIDPNFEDVKKTKEQLLIKKTHISIAKWTVGIIMALFIIANVVIGLCFNETFWGFCASLSFWWKIVLGGVIFVVAVACEVLFSTDKNDG